MTTLHSLNQQLLDVSLSPDIDSGDYQAASRCITKAACDGLQVTRSSVWQLNPDMTEMRCLVLIHNNQYEPLDFVLTENDYPAYFKALKEKRFIVASDAQHHPDTYEFKDDYLVPLGISSMLDAPIRKSGEMIGILCCEHTGTGREWNEIEESFAGALADLLGRALTAQDRLIAQKKLEETNENLKQLIQERTEGLAIANQQISEQEKMAALGQLVAGVAHEINTPIGISITTTSHIEHISRQIEVSFKNGAITETQFSEYIHSVLESSKLLQGNLNRAAELIKSFKQIAVDQSDDSFLEINLRETLLNIANSVRPELKKKYQTQIEIECPENIVILSCPGSIAQILTNLLMNAGIHAFKDDQKNRRVSISALQDMDNTIIVVEDNGQGIASDFIDKIFEPFVTTRRSQGGSGLGLNIVHNLINQKLKGEIKVESEPDQFTRFTIKLPTQPPANC